jgi:hypothetical protein
MDRLSQQMEHVAQVFYTTRDAAQTWDEAPETLKDELRLLAHQAIELVAEFRTECSPPVMEHAVSMTSALS